MKGSLNIKNVMALIAVALVWGYLVKSKFGLFETEELIDTSFVGTNIHSAKPYDKDTFKLKLVAKDPFLGGKRFITKTNSNLKPNLQPQLKAPSILKIKKWPNIAYFGYVKNRTKGKQACLVQINSHTSKMFLGSIHNEVILKSIFKDSIRVVFQGEVKTIVKD